VQNKKFARLGENSLSQRWTWLVRYVVVIIVALVLEAALDEMALFSSARPG
jgi:hypothetical protein